MRELFLAIGVVASIGLATAAQAQENEIVRYCRSDVERLCKGIEPGGGRLVQCLKAHEKEMSVGCAEALKKMRG